MRILYLCGAGNAEGVRLAQTVNRHEGRWDRLVLLDDDPAKAGYSVLGVQVEGPFDVLAGADPARSEVSNMVARTTAKRGAARDRVARYGLPFASLIAPDVDTAGAELGRAVTIYEHATVCPLAVVGDDSVVFMNAVVGHGSRLARACVIAPGAVLNARVQVGEAVYVGSNATVLPEMRIGAHATIGAGSVVLEDVPGGITVFGVPAQRIAAPGSGADAQAGQEAGAPRARQAAADLERALVAIWLEVLALPALGVEVNFFDAGGDSLAALKVCARVRERARVDLEITELFRFPTVRSLARHLVGKPETANGFEAVDRRIALRRQIHLRQGARG